MNEATIQMPRQMSTIAQNVDNMYYFIYWVSVLFFVAIIGVALWCIYRYHESKHPHATPPGHHDVLELAWTFAPLLLLIPMFHYGFKGYVKAMVAPEDAIEMRVRGKQWAWDFYYPGDTEPSPSELVVPVSRPVKMVMSSQDVLHSFFIPEFRVKRDLVPGMYSSVWFEALEVTSKYNASDNKVTGEPLDLFCTEYCGTSHSQMLAKVHVVSAEDYAAFIAGKDRPPEGKPLEVVGAELYKKNACNTCHTTDGAALVGPSFKGVFGKHEEFEDGSSLTVDENYIRQSVLQPQAKIVKGFAGKTMPTFVLKDWKIDALIAYIKSLK
ncbi:MAG TPA: cytochrome c oxidase subunit II [Polyangiaceae bacterium]|nr:cytochrome c oxidase subunit II [Polyangiaceae bacterium]